MIKTFFLVRHGENLANITKEFSCKKIDYSLTDKGFLQSRQTADYFNGVEIDAVYSSPLKRAVETSKIISEKLGLETKILETLRELDVGDLESMAPDERSWGIYARTMEEWLEGNENFRFPHGESRKELENRFRKSIEKICRKEKGKNILVVGHGGIFTNGVAKLCRIEDRRTFFQQENHNCSISEMHYSKEGKEHNAVLVRWGDIDHLTGEARQLVNSVPDYAKIRGRG